MNPKVDGSDQYFYTTSRIGNYNGNTLAYDMLCETINSDNDEKEVDKISGNRLFNMQYFTTNIDIS